MTDKDKKIPTNLEIIVDFLDGYCECGEDIWDAPDDPEPEGYLPCHKCTLKLMEKARQAGRAAAFSSQEYHDRLIEATAKAKEEGRVEGQKRTCSRCGRKDFQIYGYSICDECAVKESEAEKQEAISAYNKRMLSDEVIDKVNCNWTREARYHIRDIIERAIKEANKDGN